MKRLIVAAAIVLAAACPAFSQEKYDPMLGLSLNFRPQGAAERSGREAGFVVAPTRYLEREPVWPVLKTAEELLIFYYKQNPMVKANGIWIVTSDPKTYTAQEKALLDEVENECGARGIVLFECRFTELPGGWKRADKTPPPKEKKGH